MSPELMAVWGVILTEASLLAKHDFNFEAQLRRNRLGRKPRLFKTRCGAEKNQNSPSEIYRKRLLEFIGFEPDSRNSTGGSPEDHLP
jgi:hypothetical protein